MIAPYPLPQPKSYLHLHRMVVTLSAATPEATSTLGPQAQALQSHVLAAWGPGPMSVMFGVFLQGVSINPAGTPAVTNKCTIDTRGYLCSNILLLSNDDCHEVVR